MYIYTTNNHFSLINTQKQRCISWEERQSCFDRVLGALDKHLDKAGKARRGNPGGDSCPENVRKRMSNRCASHILSVNLLQFVGKRRFENINMLEKENVG
jgi:hypothetical protein